MDAVLCTRQNVKAQKEKKITVTILRQNKTKIYINIYSKHRIGSKLFIFILAFLYLDTDLLVCEVNTIQDMLSQKNFNSLIQPKNKIK